MNRLLAIATLLVALPAHAVVDIDWVTVGAPGNPADDTGYGSVAYFYQISKYEVTNAQYAEFLNAVAATDTNLLYNTKMGDPLPFNRGGITRSGSPGSYTYSAIAGREDMPVNHVSFWDAARFANWLHNDQPTGAQGYTTTENGGYWITPERIMNYEVTRETGGTVFVPSEHEWYKAAFYDPGLGIYYDYPAGFDAPIVCTTPGATANTANCDDAVGGLSAVGSYTGAASPFGTFDQAGNVYEWYDEMISVALRGIRGGSYFDSSNLSAGLYIAAPPEGEVANLGFRVTRPSPYVPAIPTLGLLGLAAGLLGFGVVRRGRE